VGFSYALDACCEKDDNGNWCQYTDEDSCDNSFLSAYTACEQTSYCELGCCYSSDSGSCYKNTPRATCEAEGGTWSDSSACDIEQCVKGCCTIGDQAFFVTEVKCKSVGSGYEDAAVNFDASVQTELACLESVKNLDMGCCVTEETATFVTRGECTTASTEVTTNFTELGFHEGMLCSNELLSTECAKQQTTGCYNGKVYWYDSCGNRENIYSTDERVSYNSGYVLNEIDSCVVNGANDKNCGNCDYSLGMICGEDENNIMALGEYTCVDLTCEEIYENDASPMSGSLKKNGESWCIYDSKVGEALDTVGSRHYRHLCINGEEITEPCADYREEICIGGVLGEDVLETLEALHLGSGDYVEAACRENRYTDCSSCNDAALGVSSQYSCCTNEDLRDCYWLPMEGASCEKNDNCPLGYECSGGKCVDPEEDVEPGVCVAQVPHGGKFWEEGSEVCSAASTTCSVTKRLSGWSRFLGGKNDPDKWETMDENPDGCTDRDWVVAQNVYCRSLGDCGAWYNFNGDAGLEGFSSTMFDETFFFDMDPLTVNDLPDWGYMQSVNIEDDDGIGIHSSNIWKNPITYIGMLSAAGAMAGNIGNCGEQEVKECKDDTECRDDGVCINKKCVNKNAVDGTKGSPCKDKCKSGLSCKSFVCQEDTFAASSSSSGGSSATVPASSSSGSSVGADYDLPSVEELSDSYWREREMGSFLSSSSAPANPMYAEEKENKNIIQEGSNVYQTVSGFGSRLNSMSEIGCTFGSALPLPGKWFKIEKSGLTKAMNWITVAAAVYLAVEYGLDKVNESISYTVTCGNWQPPKGGENCELCNNENTPCSEYRCKALGAACALVNEGTGNESCVAMNVNDVNSPIVEPLEAVLREQGFTFEEITDQGNPGYEIKEKIKAFTPITIGIQTDEPAQCKYSTQGALEYEAMSSFFGAEVYLYNRSATFTLGSEAISEDVIAENGGVYNIYIRCSDALGNANERDYFIRFNVDASPDLTPAEIKYTSIDTGSYMPYSVNETELSLYVNEPAECKWAKNDTGYEYMDGEMSCVSSGFQQSSVYYGTYECSTLLTGVSDENINSYFFKCMDSAGNVNEDSYEFKTKKTEEPLIIESIGPNGTIFDDTIELKVETADGANKGSAVCAFSPSDVEFNSMVMFAETNSTKHKQSLTLEAGQYSYYVTCQDLAGNRASNFTEFIIEVDDDRPVIEKLYVDEIYSVLTIEFDEEALCERASEPFVYGEGISMNAGSEYDSEFDIDFDSLEYYLTCEDKYGNFGSYYIDLSTWS
jgi:hypothetical protein